MARRSSTAPRSPRSPLATLTAFPGASDERASLRVAAYCRYSAKAQEEGYSIEAQHDAVAQEGATWEQRRGQHWNIVWFDEPAKSARAEKIQKRARFADMLTAARAGQFDLVVVHKLDRFARSLSDQLRFIQELVQHDVGFYSVVEKPDMTTPQGRLSAHILGAFAQFYSDNLAQEVRKGQRQRAKVDGLQMNRVPFGYRYTGRKTPPEPDMSDARDAQGRRLGEWEGLQRLKQLALAGYRDGEVAANLNADGRWRVRNAYPMEGVTPLGVFTLHTVAKIRKNPFYCPFTPGDTNGVVRYGSERFRGAHLAAWTWDEWHAMQRIARARRIGETFHAPQTHVNSGEFRGLLVCADCADTGRGAAHLRHQVSQRKRTSATDDGRRVYEYYQCAASHRGDTCEHEGYYARAGDVRAAWVDWLTTHLTLPDGWQDLVRSQYRRTGNPMGDDGEACGKDDCGANNTTNTSQQTRGRLLRERDEWRRKLERIAHLYEDGLYTREECRARRDEAQRQLDRIDEALLTQATPEPQQVLDAGNVVAHLGALWPELTLDERTRLATVLIEPRGLVVRMLCNATNHRHLRRGNAPIAMPFSCEIVSVRLRPAFAALQEALQGEASQVDGQDGPLGLPLQVALAQ